MMGMQGPGGEAMRRAAGLVRRLGVLVVLTLGAAGCGITGRGGVPCATGVTLEGLEIRPQHFEVSLGGFTGPSYRVEMQEDGSLLYLHHPRSFTAAPGTETERVRVTDTQWIQFRGALEEAAIWDWDDEYIDPGILDGTQWLVRIQYADASVFSRGSNSFPPGGRFRRLRGAVEALLGGREFK